MKSQENKASSERHPETTPKSLQMLEQVIIGEIDGKNGAIQSYDDIIWKIRTGYLTLLFAGWAILLQSMAESTRQRPVEFVTFIAVMFLFSLGLTVGGYVTDKIYVQRKARVIFALNKLTHEVGTCGGDLKKISLDLLQITGDDPDAPYNKGRYKEARGAARCVYSVPLVTVLMAGAIILMSK